MVLGIWHDTYIDDTGTMNPKVRRHIRDLGRIRPRNVEETRNKWVSSLKEGLLRSIRWGVARS